MQQRSSLSFRLLRLSFLALLPAAFSLAGCGDDGGSSTTTTPAPGGVGGAAGQGAGGSAGQGAGGAGASGGGQAGSQVGGQAGGAGKPGGAGGGATSEDTVAACSDKQDNDGDKFIDCDDKNCCGVVDCSGEPATYCGKQGGAGQGGAGAGQGGAGSGQGGAGASQGGSGGAPPAGGPEVVQCGTSLPAATSGVCDIVAGSGAKVLRGRVIGDDKIYEGGEVLIDNKGLIQCVGCDCSQTTGYAGATTLTCAAGVISPSLINTHDHITYAQLAPRTHGDIRYDHRHEWRKGLNGKPALSAPSGKPTADVVSWGELRFVLSGTTSTAGSGESAGMLRNLDKTATQEGLNQAAASYDTFPLGDSSGTLKTSCTYTGFTTQAEVDGEEAYLPHIAEGINAAAHNEFDCTDGSAGAQVDFLKPQTAMIHAIGLNPVDFAAMAADGTGLIWSPRSNIDLYGFTATVTAMHRMGVQISLGTDWSASGSMNMLRELACADAYNKNHLNGYFTDYQLFRMVTADAAANTASDDKIGALKLGLFGDITVWDGKGKGVFDAVVRAELADVALVLRGGLVLHGEADLVDALSPDGGAGCEALDVCGASKKICAKRETGLTIAELSASVKAGSSGELYDLFFCGPPTDEPSCLPARPQQFTGLASATDGDGDGIADAEDLCPDVFSAIRPMDGGKQADADGDGLGDACDPCPLKANSTDCPLVLGDLDADGLPDAKDNCPSAGNPDQADADADGKGDVCDACPNDANPGATPCPAQSVSVADVASKKVPVDTDVNIKGVCVTALHPSTGSTNSFWIQDPALSEFAGLYVYQASTPLTVALNDQIDISGKVAEFQGVVELTVPVITKTGTCTPIAPLVIADPASIATGGASAAKYTGMLIRVNDVAVTNVNPDAPSMFDELAVTGNLRIDDFIYDYTPATYPLGTQFSSVSGVLHFSFSNHKILPRDASELAVK